ncbi:MAG: glycerate kinase type-2 family protein [Thermoproteota archaeon]
MIINRSDILEGSSRRNRPARKIALDLLELGIESADPYKAVLRALKRVGRSIRIDSKRLGIEGLIIVIGAGKASGRMAEAVESILGDDISDGIVIVPRGTSGRYDLRKIRLFEGDHPQPSYESVKGAREVVRLVSGLDERDLVISLISGGGSSLMCLPSEGITLEDKIETTRALLKAGATIREFNTVRKHLSAVKGGMLAKTTYPAKVLNLLISDVPGDLEEIIASGPMCPDPSTFEDALRVLKIRGLLSKLPSSIEERIRRGALHEIPETPKPSDKVFKNVVTKIVASGKISMKSMVRMCKREGWRTLELGSSIEGEAREVGTVLASIGIELATKVGRRPIVALAAGETTVTVKGDGKGGRNQELALSAAIKLEGVKGLAVASMGTDGIDGVTDAAGAIVDGDTVKKIFDAGIDPREALDRNDSHNALKPFKSLIYTGPTGTNVSDIMVIVATPRMRMS